MLTGMAGRRLERVLAQGEVTEPELASFQALLEDEEAHPGLLTASAAIARPWTNSSAR